VNLLDKLRYKLAGEEVRHQTASSPTQALEALNHLPDQEKIKVLDYIQSAQSLQQNEFAQTTK
jgi:hypothetical protein